MPSSLFFRILERNPQQAAMVQCQILDDQGNLARPLKTDRVNLSASVMAAATFVQLIAGLPHLRILDLGNMTVTDSMLRAIAQHCPRLEALGLRMAKGYSEAGLVAVLQNCPCLQTLGLAWVNITRPMVQAIAQHAPNIMHLDLSGAQEVITDADVHDLCVGCPKLRWLDLSDCYDLSDASIGHVLCHGHHLESIFLSRCHHITVGGMK